MIRIGKVAALLVLTACLACLHRSPAVVLHALHPLSPAREVGTSSSAMALEVMPVRLPEALQHPQLLTALASGTYELSDTHRWGNGLDKDAQRVLVENLSALLGSDAVVPFPFGERVKATHRLEVDVQRLEGRPGGFLSLRATWMLTGPQGGPALVRKRSTLDEAVAGTSLEALVAAHDRILDRLSREIAVSAASLVGGGK